MILAGLVFLAACAAANTPYTRTKSPHNFLAACAAANAASLLSDGGRLFLAACAAANLFGSDWTGWLFS